MGRRAGLGRAWGEPNYYLRSRPKAKAEKKSAGVRVPQAEAVWLADAGLKGVEAGDLRELPDETLLKLAAWFGLMTREGKIPAGARRNLHANGRAYGVSEGSAMAELERRELEFGTRVVTLTPGAAAELRVYAARLAREAEAKAEAEAIAEGIKGGAEKNKGGLRL